MVREVHLSLSMSEKDTVPARDLQMDLFRVSRAKFGLRHLGAA